MKNLFMFIGIAVSTAFSFCFNFEEDIYGCTVQRKETPTYSDGTPMKVGEKACSMLSKNEEFGDTIIQGIPVFIFYPAIPCRKILSIKPIKSYRTEIVKSDVDEYCCAKYADCKIYPNTKIKCPRSVRGKYELCLQGKGFYPYENDCQKYEEKRIEYIKEYEIKYSETITYSFDRSKKPSYVFKQSANAFMYHDTIELYRDDGTLRYKGIGIDNGNNAVSTRGICYGADGIEEIRRTNNADFCK